MQKREAAIQKAVIAWCRERPLFALAFHVNNEGRKTIGQAMEDRRLGTLAGVPDLCIPLPEGRVVWMELKTSKGVLTNQQKAFHSEMRDFGQEVYTAYGYEQATHILEEIDNHYEERGKR